MDHDHQAEEIRRAMAKVRRDVDANTEQVINRAREISDWRYHVCKYPKLSLAAAAALGYLIVPARPKAAVPAQESAAVPPGLGGAAPSRLSEQLFGVVARLVIRNGVPLIAREAARLWQRRNDGTPSTASTATTASSLADRE